MSGFRNQIPFDPGPKGKHNAFREGDTLRALGEVQQRLGTWLQYVSKFREQTILDMEGRQYIVLAVDAGAGDVQEGSADPFQLIYFYDGSSHKVKVKYSTLAGEAPDTPTPNDEEDWEFTFTDGNKIYGKVTINGTTGEVTDRSLHSGSSIPNNTDTSFHVEIGAMFATGSGEDTVRGTSNAQYGPIDAIVCRDWYKSSPPYFGLNWQ